MREITAIRCPNGRNLLTSAHGFAGLHEHRLDMPVIGLHVVARAVLDVCVQGDDDLSPTRAAFARQQDAAIRDRVDGIAQVAVFTAYPVQIVAQMTIFSEALRVVSHCCVLAAKWKIEPCRRRDGGEFEGRWQLKGQVHMSRASEFGPEANKNSDEK